MLFEIGNEPKLKSTFIVGRQVNNGTVPSVLLAQLLAIWSIIQSYFFVNDNNNNNKTEAILT